MKTFIVCRDIFRITSESFVLSIERPNSGIGAEHMLRAWLARDKYVRDFDKQAATLNIRGGYAGRSGDSAHVR